MNLSKNVVEEKSIDFSVRIVKLYKYLTEAKKETIMARQILRSGTSIGANISEAQSASSEKDFLFKMQTASKECNETKYWLLLLYKTDFITQEEFESINSDCIELMKLLKAITKTVFNKTNPV